MTSSEPPSDEPRRPRNWAGLLDWSSRMHDGTRQSEFKEMDPERRKWLQEAFSALTVDEVKKMREDLAMLAEDDLAKQAALEQRERALGDLQMLVESLDNAADLTKIGGWPVLLGRLKDAAPSIRAGAADVLATALQNNPPVQAFALGSDTLPQLVALMADVDGGVRKKAMYAISGFVREFEPAVKVFLEADGLEVVKAALADDVLAVRIKALFLLRFLALNSPGCRDQIRERSILTTVLALVTQDDRTLREQALCTLLLLIEGNAANLAVCQDNQHGLRRNVDRIIQQADALAAEGKQDELDEMSEELQYARDLRAACA